MEPAAGRGPAATAGGAGNPTSGRSRDLALAASGATPSGWDLCAEGVCRTLGAEPGPPVRIAPCAEP